ncbi:MAG: ribonucleotide reductase [Candidatus Nanopelagicaceae bacterium]
MAEKIARTGRVQSWMDDADGRLPVSCTVFNVLDSMEGEDGIEASWRFVSHGLRNGAGVAVHLSDLRPKGDENGKGLVASGPVSFGKIYSTLNEILRRGGKYKNGAIVLHIDYSHPDALEFIKASRSELPWVKRCVNVDSEFMEKSSPELIDALLKGIASGDIWLNKIRYDQRGERIRANVCLEVYLPHRGTCLLQHVNMGACTIEDVVGAFKEGMQQLCELHAFTGVGDSGEYLPAVVDRQVGLGMLGLANFLAQEGISYKDFGLALKDVNDGKGGAVTNARTAAIVLKQAIMEAAAIARQYNMDRAFCIAPTASCSYRYTDLRGFTTTPEIAPPIARHVDRDSGTFGVESFDYGDVETAADVGWEDYKRVADELVRMYQNSGNLFHGYSFNSWSDVVIYDEAFLKDWLASPQTSLYYSLQVLPDTQRKDDAYAALDDDFKSMFGLDDESMADQSSASCDLEAGFCSACAE